MGFAAWLTAAPAPLAATPVTAAPAIATTTAAELTRRNLTSRQAYPGTLIAEMAAAVNFARVKNRRTYLSILHVIYRPIRGIWRRPAPPMLGALPMLRTPAMLEHWRHDPARDATAHG